MERVTLHLGHLHLDALRDHNKGILVGRGCYPGSGDSASSRGRGRGASKWRAARPPAEPRFASRRGSSSESLSEPSACVMRFHSRRSCVPQRPAPPTPPPGEPSRRPKPKHHEDRRAAAARCRLHLLVVLPRSIALAVSDRTACLLARRWVRLAVSLDTQEFWRGKKEPFL